jgi:hypothetical protein
MSPAHLSSSDLAPASSSLLEKFAPGKETESVLKITKRPKLRPKDVSHRRSLDGDAFASSTVGDIGSPAPYFLPGLSSHYVPSQVRPATSEWERHLMITLMIGNQRLVIPGSQLMTVEGRSLFFPPCELGDRTSSWDSSG